MTVFSAMIHWASSNTSLGSADEQRSQTKMTTVFDKAFLSSPTRSGSELIAVTPCPSFLPYLHTTRPPSVIFVTEHISTGGPFIAQLRGIPNTPKFHETVDIEAIFILQIALKK